MKSIFKTISSGLLIALACSCSDINVERSFSYENYKSQFEATMGTISKDQNWDFYASMLNGGTKSGVEVNVTETVRPDGADFTKWQTYLKNDVDNRKAGVLGFDLTSSGSFKIYPVWFAGWYPTYKKYKFEFGVIVDGVKHKAFGGRDLDKEPSSNQKEFCADPGTAFIVDIPYGVDFCFYAQYELNGQIKTITSKTNSVLLYSELEGEHDQIMVIGFEDNDASLWVKGTTPDLNDIVLYVQGNPILPVVASKRFMCEDCGTAGDFDFNDLVFDVQMVTNTSIRVTVQACGATRDIYLEVAGKNLGEIHDLLGVSRGTMVNTGYNNVPTYSTEITVPSTFDLKTFKDVKITVGTGTEAIFYTFPEEGEAPYMFAVPINTRWMHEIVSIRKGYPDFFNGAWYTNFNSEYLY